jgi:hypothetical protein
VAGPDDVTVGNFGSQLMGMRDEFRDQPHMKKYLHAFGAYDTLWVTAAEPSGRGCGFHAGRSKIAWATASQVAKWGRVAAHVSTAVRLRRRLIALRSQDVEPPPDAVLDPNGKVHDASGDAKEEAVIARLRRAVVELERIRGPTRRIEPDKALAGWKGLAGGRCSTGSSTTGVGTSSLARTSPQRRVRNSSPRARSRCSSAPSSVTTTS